MAAKTKVSVSDVRGFLQLSIDAAIGITKVTQDVHETVLDTPGPFGAAARRVTGGIAGLVYRGVRDGLRMGGAGADWLLSVFDDASTPVSSANRDTLLAAVNGVFGDHLAARGNPLATAMRFFCEGHPLPLERSAISAALPAARGRLMVFAHGLCMNERAWRRAGCDNGAKLARALGFTPVFLRYNSGLHISVNGRAFAEALDTLVAHWPTPVDDIVIIGHSMGGLVARSACVYGEAAGHSWRRPLSSMVFLGTPHDGAPLEKLGAWVERFIGAIPYAKAFGRISKTRSAGITDLRFGFLIDEDWRDHDRCERKGDCRRPIPLPEGVACFAIAATKAATVGALGADLIGDGLVPVASALGEHAERARLAFAPERRWTFTEMDHFDLLDSPEVFERIGRWLQPAPGGVRSAAPA